MRDNLQIDSKRASYALEQIQLLYKMERKAKEREITDETRKRYRQLDAPIQIPPSKINI